MTLLINSAKYDLPTDVLRSASSPDSHRLAATFRKSNGSIFV